eukprot:scaffold2201_cov162-Skeletonema_marinoi.AAC.14
MKLVLSFVAISVAAAASQDGSFIRGSADDSAAAATHVVPDDIFVGLENSPNNNFTPQQYCPRGTSYNSNGPEWPAESGCYPGTGSIPSGWPKCCDNDNCPNTHRPLCENSMAAAPSYCADMAPDESCYDGGWPTCCLVDGTTCPNNRPDCNAGGNKRSGCNKNSDCQSNEYCDFPDGTCGGNKGRCTTIPSGEDCNGVTNTAVCGCDDVKYKNYCKANQSGTSIQNEGDCSSELAFE